MFEDLKTEDSALLWPGSAPKWQMEHNGNAPENQGRLFKPTRDHLERLRRTKLVAILRDVQRVVAYDGAPVSDELQRIVTLCAAELSTIERMTSAAERMPEWVSRIEDVLGIDPFDAYALWMAHAPGPIQTEAVRWSAHVDQASRKAEPSKFYHAKLVDPAAISAALSLTRARIREIFGADRCALPPITVRKGRFPQETMAKLRALSKEVKRTPEYLGDILESQGEAGLHAVIDKWRMDMAKWSIRSRKRGRKVDPDNLTNAVKGTARQLRKSERTIWNRLRDEGSQTPESDVTFAVESCHVCSGIVRSAIPDFYDVCSDRFPVSSAHDRLAEIGMSENRKRQNPRGRYPDRELVIAWWEATRGKPPTPAQIRQWAHRNKYVDHLMRARAWAAIQGISSPPTDPANGHVTKHTVEIESDARSTRPVRGPDARPAAAPRPVTQASRDTHGG